MIVDTTSKGMLFSTARVTSQFPDGSKSTGTCFAITYMHEDGGEYPFLVTNKHVVDGAVGGVITFISSKEGRPVLGQTQELKSKSWDGIWHYHPDENIDVCVAFLQPMKNHLIDIYGDEPFIVMVGHDMLPSKEDVERIDALADVIFVGYPNGIYDSLNYLPVMRTGVTATPFSVNYEGKPTFLIDASVFGGSSGSPVFIKIPGVRPSQQGVTLGADRYILAGVVAAVYFKTDENAVISRPMPASPQPIVRTSEMIDLGIVFKSEAILEAARHLLREAAAEQF